MPTNAAGANATICSRMAYRSLQEAVANAAGVAASALEMSQNSER
ncbi:MAG: hypothetical protein ACLTLQ_08855 [[Clostridium] scindens]